MDCRVKVQDLRSPSPQIKERWEWGGAEENCPKLRAECRKGLAALRIPVLRMLCDAWEKLSRGLPVLIFRDEDARTDLPPVHHDKEERGWGLSAKMRKINSRQNKAVNF